MKRPFGVFLFIKFLVEYLAVWEELAIFVDRFDFGAWHFELLTTGSRM